MARYKQSWNNGMPAPEHRIIVEKHIGRKLNKNEHVHHINNIGSDNRIENLIIMSESEHHSMHAREYLSSGSEKAKEQIENCRKLGYKRRKIPLERLNKIREDHKNGKSYYILAKEYSVTPQAIFYACKVKNKMEELIYG